MEDLLVTPACACWLQVSAAAFFKGQAGCGRFSGHDVDIGYFREQEQQLLQGTRQQLLRNKARPSALQVRESEGLQQHEHAQASLAVMSCACNSRITQSCSSLELMAAGALTLLVTLLAALVPAGRVGHCGPGIGCGGQRCPAQHQLSHHRQVEEKWGGNLALGAGSVCML